MNNHPLKAELSNSTAGIETHHVTKHTDDTKASATPNIEYFTPVDEYLNSTDLKSQKESIVSKSGLETADLSDPLTRKAINTVTNERTDSFTPLSLNELEDISPEDYKRSFYNEVAQAVSNRVALRNLQELDTAPIDVKENIFGDPFA